MVLAAEHKEAKKNKRRKAAANITAARKRSGYSSKENIVLGYGKYDIAEQNKHMIVHAGGV